MKQIIALFLCFLVFNIQILFAQTDSVYLYDGKAPMAINDTYRDKPTIHIYKSTLSSANGSSVIIFPGGGYGHLAKNHEGMEIAKWFNSIGIHAFVVHYRLGSSGYRHPIMLMDAQRSMWWVRQNANKYGIDTSKIGIIGFSAGGHLASSLGTHFQSYVENCLTKTETQYQLRPAFMILGYPVISMDNEITHKGSKKNLLGENPEDYLVKLMSNELQINTLTPPTFIFHSSDDKVVVVENSIRFYQGLVKYNVPAEIHIFATGNHGYGMVKERGIAANSWGNLCKSWLITQKIIQE